MCFSWRSWLWTMHIVLLPEILAVDHAKRGSPRGPGGGLCSAWFSQTSWRWTMLCVVLLATLAVDHAKRGSARDPSVDHAKCGSSGGPCGGQCQVRFSQRSWRWTMLSALPPEIFAVDHAKRGPPQRSWRWIMLSVVLPEVLTVDHAERGSPRDSGGGQG